MGSFSIWHWLVILIIFGPLIIGLAVMGPQKQILVKHQQSGLVKSGYIGYSATYLFFGWFVPIIRGEIGIGALHLIFTILTFGAFQWLVMPFLYNKQYMTRLLTNNWQLNDSEDNNKFARISLGISI